MPPAGRWRTLYTTWWPFLNFRPYPSAARDSPLKCPLKLPTVACAGLCHNDASPRLPLLCNDTCHEPLIGISPMITSMKSTHESITVCVCGCGGVVRSCYSNGLSPDQNLAWPHVTGDLGPVLLSIVNNNIVNLL